MTTERYKVLGAVLALKDDFTVSDIATFNGLKANTVRTVLARESDLLDDVGKQETGSKGGQFNRYRIRSGAVDRLRSEIRELYRQFGTYIDKESTTEKSGNEVTKYAPPLAIRAAEEALIRRFPKAEDRGRKLQLIEFVRTVQVKQTERAKEDPETSPGWAEHKEFHLASLRALVDLCSVEFVLGEKQTANSYPSSILREFFCFLSEWGGRLGEQEHTAGLLNRFLMSPALGKAAHSQVSLSSGTTLASVLQAQADPQAREWSQYLKEVSALEHQSVTKEGPWRPDAKHPGTSSNVAQVVDTQVYANSARNAGCFELPPLPYDYAALEPVIDKQTMVLHHDMHHGAYVKNLNVALQKHPDLARKSAEDLLRDLNSVPEDIRRAVRNYGGGHVNHTMFWKIMKPKGGGDPTGRIAEVINKTFGDFRKFQAKFNDAGFKQFGSGWVWLVAKPNGEVEIVTTANQDSPLSQGLYPIFGNDVWEHAYYLRYNNRRPEYLAAWWNLINWEEVNKRVEALRSVPKAMEAAYS